MEEKFPPSGRWHAAFSIGRQLNRLAFRHDHFATAPSRAAANLVANDVRALDASLMLLRREAMPNSMLEDLANQVAGQINQEAFAERYNAAIEISPDFSPLGFESVLLDECRSNAGDLVSEVRRALGVEMNRQPTINLGFVFDRFIRPRLLGSDLFTDGRPAEFEERDAAGNVPRPIGNSDFPGDSESRWQPRSVREFEKVPHDTWLAEFHVACQLAGITDPPLSPRDSLLDVDARPTYFRDLRRWLSAQSGDPVEERPPATQGWSIWKDEVCFGGVYAGLAHQQAQVFNHVFNGGATRGSLRSALFGRAAETDRKNSGNALRVLISQTNTKLKEEFSLLGNPIVATEDRRGDEVPYELRYRSTSAN